MGAALRLVKGRSVGLGLPCGKCKTYYPANLDRCPVCKNPKILVKGEHTMSTTEVTPSAPISFFSKIGSFFKKIGHELEEEAANSATISGTLTVAGALLQTLVTLTAGDAAGAVVGSLIGDVNSDLAAANAVITTANVPGATSKAVVTNIINSVHANLKQLLVAAEVKNSAHAATITGTVNAVDRELLNVINAI